MEMPCLAALLAKLITFLDYRLKGNISLTVALCNAISLTTHLILVVIPLRGLLQTKWSAGTPSRSAEPRSTSAIWPRARREMRELGGGGGESWGLPAECQAGGARGIWVTPRWGRRTSARSCCSYSAGILVSRRILFSAKRERKERGNPRGTLCCADAPSQHRECPQLVTGL